MPNFDRPMPIQDRWRLWRQRLQGDREDLHFVFTNLTKPRTNVQATIDQRIDRAAALCDAALFMLWLAGIAPSDAAGRLRLEKDNLIDLRIADVVAFIGTLTANGVDDEEFFEDSPRTKDGSGEKPSVIGRKEFDLCWHKEARFRTDLIAYLFRPDVYLKRAFEAQGEIIRLMSTKDDFSDFVIAAASKEVRSATGDPVIALGSLFAASLPRDQEVRRMIAAINAESRSSWTDIYGRALRRYGRRLNDGLEVDNFTRMAAMLTEGALAYSRSDPADVTAADMLAGIQLMVNAFVAQSEALTRNDSAMATPMALDQYRRHLLLNKPLAVDEQTLGMLQEAHLDGFAYCNLDVMLGDTYFDLPVFLNRLMDSRHGGLCYQLNYPLALVLRAVGFTVDYLWGTVSKERGQPGSPSGNHLGLRVSLGDQDWLVDAGLGDGPRRPILLAPGMVQQGPFEYELLEEPGRWVLVHDKRGTFAEVTFAKNPVQMEEFRAPAIEQATDEASGFLNTLAAMKRGKDDVHLLRGRVYEVIGEQGQVRRIVSSRDEWLELLATQFNVYLGNISEEQLDHVWKGQRK